MKEAKRIITESTKNDEGAVDFEKYNDSLSLLIKSMMALDSGGKSVQSHLSPKQKEMLRDFVDDCQNLKTKIVTGALKGRLLKPETSHLLSVMIERSANDIRAVYELDTDLMKKEELSGTYKPPRLS